MHGRPENGLASKIRVDQRANEALEWAAAPPHTIATGESGRQVSKARTMYPYRAFKFNDHGSLRADALSDASRHLPRAASRESFTPGNGAQIRVSGGAFIAGEKLTMIAYIGPVERTRHGVLAGPCRALRSQG